MPAKGGYRGAERIRTAELGLSTSYNQIQPEHLGHYLAGLSDGEACFSISRVSGQNSYRCDFIIHLRADDRPLLEWLRDATGVGRIDMGRRVKQGGDQPSWRWVVSRKKDCLDLVAFFEQYPLRSKKAKDFEIWAEAVRAWLRLDFIRMAELQAGLRAARFFESVGEDWVFEDPSQLSLETV